MILSLLVILVVFILPRDNLILAQQQHGILLACLAIGASLGAHYRSFSLGAAVAYFLGRAAYAWAGPAPQPVYVDILTASSFGFLLSIVLAVHVWRRNTAEFLAILALFSCFMMTFTDFSFMGGKSNDAGMMAVLACGFLTGSRRRFYIILPLAVIAFAHSSTAALAVCLGGVAYLIAERKIDIAWLGMIAIVGAMTVLLSPEGAANDSGRFDVWRGAMQYWTDNHSHLFGAGPVFYSEGPAIQGGKTGLHTFMFNEFLETLYGGGWIGLFLLLSVGFVSLYRAFDRAWLFSAQCTYGAVMLLQFPLRMFGSALIGAMLVQESLNGPRSTQKNEIEIALQVWKTCCEKTNLLFSRLRTIR